MSFTIKDWRNATTHEGGGDTSTPISAVAIEDAEIRLSDHTELHGPAESVKDAAYGALGDGSTDDTAAFESARTGAGVGGHVYVPPGTYILDGVDLTLARQTWTLAPGAILKLKNSSTTDYCLSLDAERILLEGGEIDGNRANNVVTEADWVGCIWIRASGARIRGVYLHDCPNLGIVSAISAAATPLNDVVVQDCSIVDSKGVAVMLNWTDATVSSYGAKIVNCYAKNTGISAWQSGFTIFGATAGKIRGALIEGCDVTTDATTNIEALHIRYAIGARVNGCFLQGSGLGISCDGNEGLAITGCHVIGALDWAIEVADESRNVSVAGNTIDGDDVTGTGICLTGATYISQVNIVGNSIRNLKVAANTGYGISISTSSQATSAVLIEGNLISAADRAINITDDPIGLTITGNKFTGDSADWGILANIGTGQAVHWRINGNTFYQATTSAIHLTSSAGTETLSEVSIQDNHYDDVGDVISVSDVLLAAGCRTEAWGAGTVAAATTTTLPYDADYITVSGTASVTSITASYAGRTVVLRFTDANPGTITDGSNLVLAGNFDPDPDDTLTLVCDGTNWYETGRSSN